MHPGQSRPCIPIRHGKKTCRDRHRVEIMFGRLEEWRRIHPYAAFQRCCASSEPFGRSARYNRCAHTFMSAIAG